MIIYHLPSQVFFAVLATAYSAPQVAYAPPRQYVVPAYHHDVVPVVHQHVVPHVVQHVGHHVVPHADVRAATFVPINSQSFDIAPDGSYTFQ